MLKEYEGNENVFEGEYFSEIKIDEEILTIGDIDFMKKRWNGKGKEKRFKEYLTKIFEEIIYEDYDNIVYEGDYLEGKKTGFGKIYNEKTGV